MHTAEYCALRLQKKYYIRFAASEEICFFLIFKMAIFSMHFRSAQEWYHWIGLSSVADPNPPDPHVFGPPGSGFFYHKAKIVRKTLIPTIL
jgi:hypothetical protein